MEEKDNTSWVQMKSKLYVHYKATGINL